MHLFKFNTALDKILYRFKEIVIKRNEFQLIGYIIKSKHKEKKKIKLISLQI